MSFRSFIRYSMPFFLLLMINGIWSLLGAFYLSSASLPSAFSAKLLVSLGYSVCSILVLYLYYRKGYGSFELAPSARHSSFGKNAALLFCILLSFGSFLFFSGLLGIFGTLFPDVFEAYNASVSQTSLSSGLPTWIYTIILAPLAEELCFRGLCLTGFSRSLSFRKANIIQAVFFALIHGNLIQMVYAFILGLVLGRIYQNFGGLRAALLFHMVFNFLNVPLLLLFAAPKNPLMLYTWFFCLGILICLGILFYLKKSLKSFER